MSGKAFEFARRLGRIANAAGRSIDSNPYDYRAAGFRAAWRDGWKETERKRQMSLEEVRK